MTRDGPLPGTSSSSSSCVRALRIACLGAILGAIGWSATAAPRAVELTVAQLAQQAVQLGGGAVEDSSYIGGPAISIPSTPEGTGLQLPGSLPWAEARFLTMDALVQGDHSGEVLIQFFASGEREPRLSVSLGLFPGLRTRLALPLSALDGQTLVLPRTPGRLKGRVRGRPLDPKEIDHVTLQLKETAGPQTLYLGGIALVEREPRYRLQRTPLVDELGQWKAREWEGKTESDAFLGTLLAFALDKNTDAAYPGTWCGRGGTTEVTFKATGFFRTHNDNERWWLVDPEGHGFFSLGVDGVRPGESAPVLPGSEALFGRLPSKRGPLGGAWTGPSDSPAVESYSFALANLVRSFGPEWRKDWTEMTRSRLVAWRFNTVGHGSDPKFEQDAGLPYVIPMPPYPTTGTLLYRDFPDVYSEEFRSAAQEYAQHLVPFRDDPNLIGYFMQSEPEWALAANNIAAEMLEAHPGTETRRALAHWLSERYKGDAADWSVAWGLGLRAFDNVVGQIILRAAERSEMARHDLWEFSRAMVRAYVGIPGLACHEVDPNHLNLGMRYAGVSSDLLYEAVGVFDVFSINGSQMRPPADQIAEIAERTRRPVLIGGFHFGALDRGLPSTGLQGVASQRERGIAYRHYVEAAAANPNVIGAHYSILNDQPLLGRFDGENSQIGFVDVCHRPYRDLVDPATRAHEVVYELMNGTREPYVGKAREIPRVGHVLLPVDARRLSRTAHSPGARSGVDWRRE